MYDNRGTVEYQDIPSIAERRKQSPYSFLPARSAELCANPKLDFRHSVLIYPVREPARTCNLILPAGSRIHRTASHGPRASAHGDDPTGLGAYFDCRGQDQLFFAPLAPTSLATLAAPALSYAGNLWAGHRKSASNIASFCPSFKFLVPGRNSRFTSGDFPDNSYIRYPAWGEMSGQPAYAGRFPGVIARSGRTSP